MVRFESSMPCSSSKVVAACQRAGIVECPPGSGSWFLAMSVEPHEMRLDEMISQDTFRGGIA
jgi:hypothetical protein